MAQKKHLFEEGYGKGWLYKDLEFIDFVFYHYQVHQLVSTTSFRAGKKTGALKYQLSGNLKFVNFTDKLQNAWYTLLVNKQKGFKIHLESKDEFEGKYFFSQERDGYASTNQDSGEKRTGK